MVSDIEGRVVFSSRVFLFLFLPLFLTMYFAAPARLRNHVVLLFSLVFYAWGEPGFLPVIIASSILDYLLACGIFRSAQPKAKKALLFCGVASNVFLLVYFKYVNFFIDNINHLLTELGCDPMVYGRILLPLALSFIAFEKITYLVDVYRGMGKPAPSFADYFTYVLLFPKLIAGPIIKYHDIEADIRGRRHSVDAFIEGFARFIVGLGKKTLIADSMGEIADAVFAQPSGLGFYDAWSGALCFTLQIYFDFSAYSDMAIGLLIMMGFSPGENFILPYIAKNFTEFWRRWHISLSSFIREYLYIPLGGNRCGVPRQFANLSVCFLLSGLWHGADWTFVVWGVYHGFFLCYDKARELWANRPLLPPAASITMTFLFVTIGWVLFRANTLADAGLILQKMFYPGPVDWQTWKTAPLLTANIFFFFLLGLFLSFFPACRAYSRLKEWQRIYPSVHRTALLAVFLFSVGKLSVMQHVTFIYFRF
jgi:alginate O-acetyltransferase complex protein AlgI